MISALAALPAAQRAALEAAYATPARAYHHFGHVHAVLAQGDVVAAAGPGWRQPAEVAMAMLYHDAVYDAGRSDNEARSAQLAAAHLQQWPQPVDPARVQALILLTARHGRLTPADVAGDADAALFLDCDMAILGADPAAFDAYDRGIAGEYRGKVPGWTFALNRRRFLKRLLAAPRIYLSDFFHARLDAGARRNLRRAITRKQ